MDKRLFKELENLFINSRWTFDEIIAELYSIFEVEIDLRHNLDRGPYSGLDFSLYAGTVDWEIEFEIYYLKDNAGNYFITELIDLK